MRRLTSRMTFIYKRVVPIFWFGFWGVFVCAGIFNVAAEGGPALMFIVAPLGMGAVSYFVFKNLVWDLVDEVHDESQTFAPLFKNKGKEARVSLKDIKNVSYSSLASLPKVTIRIRCKTPLGDELSFSPPTVWVPFRKHKLIEELIDRIDQARG